MYFVDAPFPGGTVVVLSHELSRYADFTISLMRLKAPGGSGLHWQKGVEIVLGLNNAIRNLQGEWLWILGDDHTFQPDTLLKLLERDVDIVVPACASRIYPFLPVIFWDKEGTLMHTSWDTVIPNSLIEVAGAGTAGMLIKKRVLDALGDPWFEAGKHNAQTIAEDLWFCRRAREAGFKVHLDSSQMIGHITPATIWPAVSPDGVMTPLANFNGDEKRWVRLDSMIILEETKPVIPAPNLLED